MPCTACFFQNFEINNISAVKNNNVEKKYTRFNGSLGFSNANSPAASNDSATNKAKKSIKTNRPPIRKKGKISIITVFLFIAPKGYELPIYEYTYSHGSTQRQRFERFNVDLCHNP